MNAKFIFWQNIEFLKTDYSWSYLTYEEREGIKHITLRNTAKPVPYAEDSKALKMLVDIVKERMKEQKGQIDGVYARQYRPIGRI